MTKGMQTVVLSLMLAIGLSSGNFAVADPITFNFTGDVTLVFPELSGTFNTTQSLSGFFTFESTLTDDIGLPILGRYFSLTYGEFTIGGYTATMGGAESNILIQDFAIPEGAQDLYRAESFLLGPSVNGFDPFKGEVVLIDNSGTVFGDDSLPLTPPDLSSFDVRIWQLIFRKGGNAALLSGTISTLTLQSALTAEEQIVQLVADVVALNLKQGISNSLDGKLDNAVRALDDLNENNDVAAINSLQAVINFVEAQRGGNIPETDADALIAAAQEIITLLGG